MKKEIKFRTWQENKMYFHELCNYLGSSGISNPYIGCENAIWMQFTGLQDKNGVDIYEGDILKVLSTNKIYEVIFHKCAFGIKITEYIFAPIYWNEDIEVIGNIHKTK